MTSNLPKNLGSNIKLIINIIKTKVSSTCIKLIGITPIDLITLSFQKTIAVPFTKGRCVVAQKRLYAANLLLFILVLCFTTGEVKAQINNKFDFVISNAVETTSGYSLRRLSSTYFGSAIEVRRSGDNALKNIGFMYSPDYGTNFDFDTPSLIAFTDAGNVWNTGVAISGANFYYHKQLANGYLLVASYSTNKIHLSINNGVNWNAGVVVAAGAGLRGITQLANGEVLATGYLDNKVYRSLDNGLSWNAGTVVAAGAGLSGITQLSNGDVLTVGTTTNRVYRSTDNGTTWDVGVEVAAGAGLSGITQLSNGDLLVTGNTSNKIYRSTDFGATWDAGTTITGATLTGITQLASGHVVAVDNAANKIYRSQNNGYTWDAGSLVALGAGIVGISQLTNGDVIASATNGRIYRSVKLNAFVRTWYDQSGRNLRAVQTANANQPRIVNAGVIEQVNGKPAVYFTGSSHLRCFSPTQFPTTGFSEGFTANVVAKWTTTGSAIGNSQTLIDNNYNGTQGFIIRDRPDLPTKPASFGITVSPGTLSTVSDNTQTGNGTARILSFLAKNTTVSGFKEGTAMATSAITGTNYALQTTMVIGARWNNGTVNSRLTGHISEIIIIPAAPNCEIRDLEQNQSYYFNTTYDNSSEPSVEYSGETNYTCVNTPYTKSIATTGISGINTTAYSYLPPGLTASWANNVLTISGTPPQVYYDHYLVPLNPINPNTCRGPILYASGTISVTNPSLNTSPNTNPTVCPNTVMPNIIFNLGKAFIMGTPVNLPPGVSAGDPGYSANSIRITGTPTQTGTFNYTIPLTDVTCVGNVTLSGTITVTNTQINNVGPASSSPTLCVGAVLPTITHTTTAGTGIGPASGLPPGVTATFANNVIRISGTPTVANVYNYSIPLLGACGSSAATGTITVTTSGTPNTVGPPSSSPTICLGVVLPTITHATTGATGIGTATGLPGVTATWAGNVITISGTPTMNGTFNYSIPLIGGCGNVSATGTITVNAAQPYITSSLPVTAVGTVSTFAGNSSYSNVNGTGTAASFRRPEGAVADAAGNIYVVDPGNQNIRKITPAGVVTTFAGNTGTSTVGGYVDATGTAARFNYPNDIAIDRFGNLFVADAGNNLIRKITPQGVVSTYAGVRNMYGNQNGPALQATFSYPYSITADAAGNVYVGDYDYNIGGGIIRKITPEGIVSTFAGSGNWVYQDGPGAQAGFSDISAMCADATGNLYLADWYRVRKVTPSGFVSTVAGNGIYASADAPVALQASFSYITGIVLDAAGNLYLTDVGDQTRGIRRITPAGVVSTLAGSTAGYVDGVGNAARFDFSNNSGLCIDYSGNLFAMDMRRIRKIVVAETVGACIGDAVTLTANGGTSYSWSGPQAITNGVPFTVAAAGTHTVTVTNGSCSPSTRAITINVNQPTITADSNPSVCVNTILNITRTTTVATGIGVATGLPPGVTATWAANVLTIIGIPSQAGVFTYSIPLLGGCPFNATGTITVNDNTVSAPSSTPSLCINTPLSNIIHTTTGATGIGLAIDLPSGVTASWAGNTITISGTPTEEGIFEYSIPLTGGCGNDNAQGTITVGTNSADNSAGSAASSPTICISDGLSDITFNTTGATGIINSGISGANGLPPGVSATWAANVITISGTPTNTGTFPYSIPLTGGCGSVFATGTITIFPSPVGGSIDGSATVCSGTNSTNLILSGHTGTITGWESTLTNFATAGTPIANTSTSLTVSNLTATTSYRAVITIGSCVTYSATATVTVSPASVGGTATATPDTLCSGNSTTITLTGNTGSTIQWQQSSDGSTGWATVTGGSGGTTATYTTPNLTATTYYRTVVTSGACVAAYSATAPVTVTAFPASVGGTITGSASVCSGTNSTILTLGGHIGTVTRWESSLNNFTTAGTTINNTATTLTATNLTATTSYRAVVTNGACAATNSAPATVTVSPASVGGTATATPPTLCSGNFTTITLTGNTGSTIQWQQSADGSTGWATVTGGSGGTTATYTTPNLIATTYYRAVVTSGACIAANSAIALVSVTASPASAGGTITGSASVCSGTNSTVLTLSGHTGTITRWESSLDNFTTAGTTINNTATTLTATNLTATTSYRAVVTNGACAAAYSTTATVTISPASVGGTATAAAPTICSGNSTTITLTGNTGSTIQWQQSANGSTGWATVTGGSGGTTATYTTPNLTATTYYRAVVTSGACAAANSATATILVTIVNTWGGITANWNDNQNWCSGVPAGTANVTIPSGVAFYPIITTGTVQVNNITIASGASVTLNNGELSISGTISNNGSLDATNGSLTLNGTAAAQTISGSMFVGKTIKNLKISNSNGVSLVGANDTLKLTGFLNFGTSNAVLTTNGNLTLVSNAAATACVADMTNGGANSGNDIIGNVTVERYIANQPKAWRFLSTPTSGQTIKNAWMEGNAPLGNTKPGYGAIITSNNPGALSLGFDIQTASNSGPSMKTYNPATSNWNGVANTNTQMIANKKGYMVFIRGDRSVTAFNQAATATTLRTTGQLYTRGVNAPAPSTVLPGKMESIGNPYASEIDFTLLTKTGSIDNTFYVWDPLLTVGSSGLGGYQTISATNGWKPTPGGTANYDADVVCKTIKSGYAFFVFSSGGGGTVSFTETAKTNSLVSRQQNQHNMAGRGFLRTNLFNAAGALTDGNVVAFDQAFSNEYDGNDALKLINATENLGIQRDTNNLSVEARSPVNTEDTVFYTINNMRAQAYRLKFMPENMNDANVSALLVDRFLNTTTAINLNDSTVVNFSITANTASAAANRFYVVFKPIVLLPVTITGISAGRNSNGTITVNWKSENETAIEKYELERGGDGRNFSRIKTVLPVANNGGRAEYTELDTNPLSGNNFYRIKAISTNGLVQYSNIAKVADIRSEYRIAVFPNPVINKTINISFSNQSAGRYIIQLINALGQTTLSKSEMLDAAPQTKKIFLGNQLPSGNYQLKIIAPDGKTIVTAIVVD
jgi:hypothetical protein